MDCCLIYWISLKGKNTTRRAILYSWIKSLSSPNSSPSSPLSRVSSVAWCSIFSTCLKTQRNKKWKSQSPIFSLFCKIYFAFMDTKWVENRRTFYAPSARCASGYFQQRRTKKCLANLCWPRHWIWCSCAICTVAPKIPFSIWSGLLEIIFSISMMPICW